MSTNSHAKPLAGTRVVDFSRLLPGAYCTWILASLGAEVIKVEQPGKGDYQRNIGLSMGRRGSALFQMVNQGKRSMGLDLKKPYARPLLAKLLNSADIVVESFRPGVTQRLGIDLEALRAERPAVVCVSINGFGASSPLRLFAAHDLNYLALSGLMHRQLHAGEGIADVPFVDLFGGLIAAFSALALLYRARLTGVGGIADAALADALPLLPYEVLATALSGMPEPRKEDSPFAGAAANYTVYTLRDGYVAVGAVEEEFWREFLKHMRLEFAPVTSEPRQSVALKQELTRRFAAMSRAEVEALFRGADACVTVVKTYHEVLASEHAGARQYVAAAPAPGNMPLLGSPFYLDGKREFAQGVAPLLGEHTAQILTELDCTPSEIAVLAASGVVAIAPQLDADVEQDS